MANTLNITSSIEPVVDTSSTVGGQTYTESAIDKNTGAMGGLYKSLTYTATKAVKYSGVVSAVTAAVVASAFEANNAVGSAPAKVKAVAISFDSALGNTGTVDLEISTTGTVAAATYNGGGGADATGSATITLPLVIARLSVGESVVIPLSSSDSNGIVVANIKILNANYVNSSVEATVSVSLLGTA